MSNSILDPIILGHNQFFGVNHLSAMHGARRATEFRDTSRVLDIVRQAHELGAGGLMLSTHARSAGIADAIANDSSLAGDLHVYPLLPYIQKYVTRANEVGMINVVLESLQGQGLRDKIATVWSGSKGVLTKDVHAVLATLMRFELKIFRDLQVPAIFLHDALTDLALAFGLKDIFAFYIEEIGKTHKSSAAFATKNAPMLLDQFKEWGLPAPIIMTHVNKSGFHMNPDRDACLESFSRHPEAQILAMGTLASGHLKPDEAYAFLGDIPQLDAVVVGASTREHLQQSFGEIQKAGIGAGKIGA